MTVTAASNVPVPGYDLDQVRADFPILHQQIAGNPLVYLDNAATTQKPTPVIRAITDYYAQDNANIHRGVHTLSQRATDMYEGARQTIANWLSAESASEIIFVRGATEGINLVAATMAATGWQAGDQVLITGMEHHSNIVPWQILRDRLGIELVVVPLQQDGTIRLEDVASRLTDRTRLVSIVHVSNALGTVNPVRDIIAMARERSIPVLLDGAQAAPHTPLDMQDLGCDFYVLSGHKVYGPTGIGVLYGRREWLDRLPPYHGGGDMIRSVTFAETTYAPPPYKFEAGTPNIAGVIGLAAAVRYLEQVGIDRVAAWESELLDYATATIGGIDGVTLIGTGPAKAGVLSFVIEGIHPHDIGTILDMNGVAIRAGHHCAQPVMDFFQVPATARASFAMYNTLADIDSLAAAVRRAQEMFG